MSKRGGPMTKVLFFVFLFTGICWTETGDAFEAWEGKAITVLNVRRTPGLDGQAVGWLNKGETIIINDEKKEWCKIVFRGEGKRYREGWVHSRYIQRISSKKKELSSALAKVRAGIAVEELQEKIPLDASAGKDRLSNGIEKELNKASTPAATHVVRGQARMTSQAGLLSGKKNVKDPLPGKANAVKEETSAASRTKSPTPKMEVGTSLPPTITPVVSKRVDTLARTIVPVVQKPLKQELMVSHAEKTLTDTQKFKELAKLALRLLSVVLSCIAILFSYKAIKLAKISYNTAMHLQHDLQVWQQREDR
jgi:uncharacterized protein YraI